MHQYTLQPCHFGLTYEARKEVASPGISTQRSSRNTSFRGTTQEALLPPQDSYFPQHTPLHPRTTPTFSLCDKNTKIQTEN